MIKAHTNFRPGQYTVEKEYREKLNILIDRLLRIDSHKNIWYMNNIYYRDHIHTFTIDPRIDPTQTQQTIASNKEVEIIHSGFSAGKLENQNESAYLIEDIRAISSYEFEGVTT